MKTMYLIRHAEASVQGANVKDFDRRLNTRGEEDLAQIGKRLRQWPKPDIVISSPALRAKTTATILATALNYPMSDITFDERIYEAGPEDLVAVMRAMDNMMVCAMLVGHNPALTQLVHTIGQCDIENMPTCSMAVLQFPSDSWDDLGRISAELLDFDYPGKDAE